MVGAQNATWISVEGAERDVIRASCGIGPKCPEGRYCPPDGKERLPILSISSAITWRPRLTLAPTMVDPPALLVSWKESLVRSQRRVDKEIWCEEIGVAEPSVSLLVTSSETHFCDQSCYGLEQWCRSRSARCRFRRRLIARARN
jgi:hypothetical protein